MDALIRQTLLANLQQLTLSENWEDVSRLLAKHPEVLSRESIDLFADVISKLEQQQRLKGAQSFRKYYDFLLRARIVGVPQALAELRGEGAQLPPELRAIFKELLGPEPPPHELASHIQLLNRALGMTTQQKTPLIWAAIQGRLGMCLLKVPEGDRAKNLQRARDAFEKASTVISRESRPILWAINTNYIARTQLQLSLLADRQKHLAEARANFCAALVILTGGMGARLLDENSERMVRMLSQGTAEDFDRAIQLVHDGLRALDDLAADAGVAADIGKVKRLMWEKVALPPDCGAAGQKQTDPLLEAAKQLSRYWELEEPAGLFRAVEILSTLPPRADVQDLLGKALHTQYVRTGERQHLERAIELHREAVDATGRGDADSAHYRMDLSLDLMDRYTETGEPADLDLAVDLAVRAAEWVGSDSEERPLSLLVLGRALRTRYLRSNDPKDLESSISQLSEASRLAPPASKIRLGILRALAEALHVRHVSLGDPADLNEAVECDQKGVHLAANDFDRAVMLHGLGGDLQARYESTGALEDLENAIPCFEQAISLFPASSPNRVYSLCELASALSLRYDISGNAKDLEESIATGRQALDLLPVALSHKTDILNRLSSTLRDRYLRTGDLNDLESAINLSRQALAAAPQEPERRAVHLLSLGIGLRMRYEQKKEEGDLTEAIRLLEEALASTSGSTGERGEILDSLGGSFALRYALSDDLGDLQKSIGYWEDAGKLTPESSPQHAHSLNNLAAGLLARFHRAKDAVDLEQAVAISRQAVAITRARAPSRVSSLTNLALALGKRYDQTGKPKDLSEARCCFRDAASLGLDCNLSTSLTASLWWADWAFFRKSWSESSEAFALAFRAVDGLLDNQMSRVGKETWLGKAQELAADAAFVRAKIDDLEGAVEALEHGRLRLLAEAQERSRLELEKLRETGHADLYDAFQSATQRAHQLESRWRPGQAADDWVIDVGFKAAHASERKAIAAIRQVPDYDDLFGAPQFEQIHGTLTSEGAVGAYLTVTRAGGVALIVLPEGVRKVWLDFDRAELMNRLVKRDGGRITGGYLPALFEPSRLSEELDECLPWLGKKIIEPVLDALRLIASPPLEDNQLAPSVSLVATGYLGLLPLHACYHELAGKQRAALKDCTFSYVLSARALAHARAALKSAPSTTPSLLAVANPLPLPQGTNSLPFARLEVERIARLFAGSSELLGETRATYAELEPRLGRTTHLHLACHARFNPNHPLSSELLLSGRERLRLGDLLKLSKLNATRLAILSACQTAITDFNHLPEEAIGLPAGFLQTGVPGVIGTLWPVVDVSTALLLIKFYEYLFGKNPAPPMHPSHALRRAQLWLRNVSCEELSDSYYGEARLDHDLLDKTVESKFRSFALRDPTDRPFQEPYFWAPFAFYGT